MNRELLDGMKLSVSLMTSIMSNLLDSRKLQEGMMELRPQPMSLSKLLDDCHSMMMPLVKPGVQFINENSTPLPKHDWVVGDYYRIQQVLTNMITNAIKYTLVGHIRLRAFWTINRQVQIEIIDSGPGIPVEVQPKLFERFVQRGGAPGHGLGLPISKSLVEMMGGTIRFVSDPSVKPGTTCVVVLPLEPVLITGSGTDASITQDDDVDSLSLTSEEVVVSTNVTNNGFQTQHQRGVPAFSSTQGSTTTAPSNINSSVVVVDNNMTRKSRKTNRTSRNPYPDNNTPTSTNILIEEPIQILIVDDIKINRYVFFSVVSLFLLLFLSLFIKKRIPWSEISTYHICMRI